MITFTVTRLTPGSPFVQIYHPNQQEREWIEQFWKIIGPPITNNSAMGRMSDDHRQVVISPAERSDIQFSDPNLILLACLILHGPGCPQRATTPSPTPAPRTPARPAPPLGNPQGSQQAQEAAAAVRRKIALEERKALAAQRCALAAHRQTLGAQQRERDAQTELAKTRVRLAAATADSTAARAQLEQAKEHFAQQIELVRQQMQETSSRTHIAALQAEQREGTLTRALQEARTHAVRQEHTAGRLAAELAATKADMSTAIARAEQDVQEILAATKMDHQQAMTALHQQSERKLQQARSTETDLRAQLAVVQNQNAELRTANENAQRTISALQAEAQRHTTQQTALETKLEHLQAEVSQALQSHLTAQESANRASIEQGALEGARVIEHQWAQAYTNLLKAQVSELAVREAKVQEGIHALQRAFGGAVARLAAQKKNPPASK
jgi:hypothetical protein